MDGKRRDGPTGPATIGGDRRALLRILALVPFLGGLAAFLAGEETAVGGRRKRRKKRIKQKQNRRTMRRRRAQRKRCSSKPQAVTCAGTCGTVKDSCGKSVDCGPCDPVGGAECEISNGSDLQAAIDAAAPGATLTICAGTFGRVLIEKNLSLIGAGSGADPASNTVIDGGNGGSVVIVPSGYTVSLQGLRITGGNSPVGGGIQNAGALTVTDCAIVQNSAPMASQGDGGGVYNVGSGSVALVTTTIANNVALAGGGIFQSSTGMVSLDRCRVEQNTAAEGGGILAGSGTVSITMRSAIANNQAQDVGGGLAVAAAGVVTFDGTCRVTGNSVQGGVAGGIFNEGTVQLNGAAVTNNSPTNCAGPQPVSGCVNP